MAMIDAKTQEISLKKKVLSGVFWFGATSTIGQAISWAITIYVARILSPGDYGLMGMSGIFTGFMMMINELGLGDAIVRRKDLTSEDLSSIFWIIVIMNFSLYLMFVLLAPLLATFFKEPRLVSVIRITSLTFIINSIGYVSCNMLIKKLNFAKRSQAAFMGNLSGVLSTLFLAIKGFGVWSLVYGSIVSRLTENILLVIYHPWKPKLVFSYQKIKRMLNFGLKITGSRVFWYFYSNSDFLIAGRVLGKTLLGFYSMAFQFASLPLDKITANVVAVMWPAFSEVQDDIALLKRYFLKTVRISAFITFPMFMGLFLVADDAVSFFLTQKWAPLIIPLKALCIVSTIRAINAINSPLVYAKGRPGIPMMNNLIFAIVLPIAFYIGSFYGLEGLSYSWLFAFPAVFLLTTYISLNAVGISMWTYVIELKDVVFGTIFMVAVVILCQKTLFTFLNGFGKIAAMCLAGAISYLLYYFIFKRDIFIEAKAILKRQ